MSRWCIQHGYELRASGECPVCESDREHGFVGGGASLTLDAEAPSKSKAKRSTSTKGRNHHGHTRGKMNSTERAYSRMLEQQLLAGEVASWHFESMTLIVVPGSGIDQVTWTPDFVVHLADGTTELVDVKGKQKPEQAQLVKAKACAARWPFRVVIAAQVKGGGFKRRIIGAS